MPRMAQRVPRMFDVWAVACANSTWSRTEAVGSVTSGTEVDALEARVGLHAGDAADRAGEVDVRGQRLAARADHGGRIDAVGRLDVAAAPS